MKKLTVYNDMDYSGSLVIYEGDEKIFEGDDTVEALKILFEKTNADVIDLDTFEKSEAFNELAYDGSYETPSSLKEMKKLVSGDVEKLALKKEIAETEAKLAELRAKL